MYPRCRTQGPYHSTSFGQTDIVYVCTEGIYLGRDSRVDEREILSPNCLRLSTRCWRDRQTDRQFVLGAVFRSSTPPPPNHNFMAKEDGSRSLPQTLDTCLCGINERSFLHTRKCGIGRQTMLCETVVPCGDRGLAASEPLILTPAS